MRTFKNIQKIIAFCLLSIGSSIAHGQTVYPDLDNILTCSDKYIKTHYSKIINSSKPLIIAGSELSPCDLYSSTLSDYNLALGKLEYKNNKSPSVLAYLVVNKKLTDNEIATMKHIAQTSQGFSPGYLDSKYNFVTFFLQTEIFEGKDRKILMQKETYLPIMKQFIADPDKTLVLEIIR